MTARVMYKLRVALQMSCTRSVGSKSFEAIIMERPGLLSQGFAALLYSYVEALPECISDRRLRSDYTREENIGCKNKLIAFEKSDYNRSTTTYIFSFY